MIPETAESRSVDTTPQITSGGRPPLTIDKTEALITDSVSGGYPHRSAFRDELVRSLRFAVTVWGKDRTWESIDGGDWVRLFQRRLDVLLDKETKGIRAAEITVSRLITAVRWLRKTRWISRDAAQWPEKWKDGIVKYWEGKTGSVHDPELLAPHKFTVEEAQRILDASRFDPRFELLMWLGMGRALGAVARLRRGDLDLPKVDWAHPDTDYYGKFTFPGKTKKKKAGVPLTAGQRVALDRAMLEPDGYLYDVERRYNANALKNYVLFPSGYVVGRVGLLRGKDKKLSLSDAIDFARPVTGSWVRNNFRVAERLAGVKHIQGRSAFRLPMVGAPHPDTVASPEARLDLHDRPPDFAPLTSDPVMAEILQQRWEECVRCVQANAHLAATVMMGGLLEALLHARARRMTDKTPLLNTRSAPYDRTHNKTLDIRQWTLAPLIDAALELGWFTPSAKDVAVVLRDYRNYVHPEKQREHGMQLQMQDSRMFWDLTKHLARQLLESASGS